MDLDFGALQLAWPIPGPWEWHPLTRGTNNHVLLVETPAGGYVLRIYGNHADLDRLHFEHAVLCQLHAVRLPFAVPVPVPTVAGELHTRVVTGNSEGLAMLTAHIPGEHPRAGDLEQARAGGEALGLLDVALDDLTSLAPDDGISWRTTGDLAHCHPFVPEPHAAFRELPVSEHARQRLVQGYEWLMEHVPDAYATLPKQIIHEDFDMSNVLLDSAHVTGVLDFEFCGRDVRLMDLTVALNWWPLDYFGTGGEWPIIDALAAGYMNHVTLTDDEIASLPLLVRFRAYTSLIHRLGRYRQGLSSLESVINRAYAAVERQNWLHAHGDQLIAHVRQAACPQPPA